MPSTNTEANDLYDALLIHIGTCEPCNRRVMAVKSHGQIPVGSACEEGKRMSIRWLEFASQHGNRQAWYLLGRLKETGAYTDQRTEHPDL